MKRTADELDWLAFRYIASELHADEAASFEQRLASDQAAREAVARAVELTEAVAIAEESAVQRVELPADRRSLWKSPLVSMSIGAAACVALMYAIHSSRVPFELASHSPEAATELAAAWVGELATDADDVQVEAADELEQPLDDDSLEPPSWMVAALGGVLVDGEE